MLRSAMVLATAGLLSAQGETLRFVPADSLLTVRVAGPAAWRDAFADTRIARLLHGPALRPLMDRMSKGFEEMAERMREQSTVDFDALSDGFSGYRGDILVTLQMDMDEAFAAAQEDADPPIAIAFIATPDGHTDLDAMAQLMLEDMEQSLERASLQPRDLEVAGHRLRVQSDGELEMTAPFVVDGHLLMLIAADLEAKAPGLLDVREPMAADALPAGTLAGRFAVAPVRQWMLRMMADGAGEDAPVDFEALSTALGFGALRDVEFALDASGEHLHVRLGVGLEEQSRGLFEVLGTPDSGRPRLQSLLPGHAAAFSVQTIDLGALRRTIAAVWEEAGDALPMSFDDVEAAFAEATKVRLDEDLLAHMGSEMLQIGDYEAQARAIEEAAFDDREPGAGDLLVGTCFAMKLRDGRAFGDSLEQALRSRGMHAGRKTEDYQGTKVHLVRVFGMFPVEYAVTEDLLLLQLGEPGDSSQFLRAVLDERAARAAGDPPAELPAPVRDRIDRLPAHWNGFGVQPMEQYLGNFQRMMRSFLRAAPPQVRAQAEGGLSEALAVLDKVVADLRTFGLETLVSTTYVDRKGLATEMLW
ncbi:MAG: hypothetical protein AB7O97_12115 [Planctomycetota bacterium]